MHINYNLDNQTVHELDKNGTIQEAIDNLKKQYLNTQSYIMCKDPLNFLHEKAKELFFKKKLKDNESRVIEIFFEAYDIKNSNETLDLFKLAICALEDQDIAKKMLYADKQDVSKEQLDVDMQERWASWFRAAVIESQLAYNVKQNNNLSKGEIINSRSCLYGINNRIIHGLNLIHPGVSIEAGDKTKKKYEVF